MPSNIKTKYTKRIPKSAARTSAELQAFLELQDKYQDKEAWYIIIGRLILRSMGAAFSLYCAYYFSAKIDKIFESSYVAKNINSPLTLPALIAATCFFAFLAFACLNINTSQANAFLKALFRKTK